MDEFDYSLDAINVLSLFHDSEFIVYVEGEDDVCFWQNILNLANISNYYIESVGGSENLGSKISQIMTGGARIIVAKDRDDTLLDVNAHEHTQIVTTHGYSIENHMYCPVTINNIINNLAKTKTELVAIIHSWYDIICKTCQDLILYNIANNIYGKGVKVFGDNCCRYLVPSNSCKLCKSEIDLYVSDIKCYFCDEEIEKSNMLVGSYTYHNRYLIKGHFLTHAVINLIKVLVKKITGKKVILPIDNLYALTVDGCNKCKNICEELNSIIEKVKLAHAAIERI